MIFFAATYNVARKARNKAVEEDKVAGTDVDTDYSKPRNRKRPNRFFSSSESEDETDKKVSIKKTTKRVGSSKDIPAPTPALPSKLKRLLESAEAKAAAKNKQKAFAVSAILVKSPTKNQSKHVCCNFSTEKSFDNS